MLSLSHKSSSPQRSVEEIAADMGPEYTVIDGLVTHKSKLTPEGKKKPKYDYRVPQAAPCETSFRHSHWKARRERVHAMLESAGVGTFALDRFAQCGSGCVVEMTKGGEKVRLKACYCHSKHCEPCMRAKSNKIAANLRTRLGDTADGSVRFITLTLRHTKTPLTDQIKKLYASFRRLRSYPEWKESQCGGAAMLEVKYDAESGFWHPHLHILSEGNFLHKRDLSRLWHKATGDSFIADIRQMKDKNEVAHYVTKYISKGTSPGVWDSQSIAQEWILASKGVRTMLTFGTWRGFKLLHVAESDDEWRPVVTMIELYNRLAQGEPWALRLMQRLEEKRLAREKTKPPQMVLIEN